MRTTPREPFPADEVELTSALHELQERLRELPAQHDESAMRSLCVKVEQIVRRMAGKALRAHFELDDLCQEGLMALVQASRRAEEAPLEAKEVHWRRVLHARIIDLARRGTARKRADVATQFLDDLAPSDLDRAMAREDDDFLAQDELASRCATEMAALPVEQRSALEARVFEGATIGELALRFERSEEAVRQLLSRARKRLRRALCN